MSVPACVNWPIPERGMSMAQWQDGRCAVCGFTATPLVTDHDHVTGLERGYLCRSCNTSEGQSGADIWRRWRSGSNPAAILGVEVEYSGRDDHLREYLTRTAVNEDELRAAINLLGGAA